MALTTNSSLVLSHTEISLRAGRHSLLLHPSFITFAPFLQLLIFLRAHQLLSEHNHQCVMALLQAAALCCQHTQSSACVLDITPFCWIPLHPSCACPAVADFPASPPATQRAQPPVCHGTNYQQQSGAGHARQLRRQPSSNASTAVGANDTHTGGAGTASSR